MNYIWIQIRLSDSIEVFGKCESWEAEKIGKTGLEQQRMLSKRSTKPKMSHSHFKLSLA